MIPLKEAFPDCIDDDYFRIPGYTALLKSFGFDLVLNFDIGQYQGSTYCIFRDLPRYGYMVFGWGSCSGCDSLEACSSYEDLDKLRQSLFNSIRWFESAPDCAKYLLSKDWETEVGSLDSDEQKKFLNEALPKILTPEELEVLKIMEA